MTTERETGRSGFLPGWTGAWLAAAGALLLYLVTLNHWVSFGSLTQVAKLSGWTWQVELSAPLYLTVTYPLRWLPAHLIPLALNLFAAVCGTLVLALLYRCVCLLPHDRTVAQRERERGEFALLSIPARWAPPLFAVLICGLQISFWENATASMSSPPWSQSGHMFDLLCFAYVVRCVLEYRIDERESWLMRAAFVMGLSMTNDWAMIGYFPLFLVALMWIRGLSFFNAQFLLRMFAWGTAGLLLYFLLPIAFGLFHDPKVPFWYAFKQNLGMQRFVLQQLWTQKQILAVLSFTSLLPVLFMGIRWSSYFGDTSRTGTALARFIFHIVHLFFLAACVWIALDPQVSPRNQNVGVPFLSFYFLGALGVGYFSGYLLLVFGPRRSSRRHLPPRFPMLDKLLVGATWAVMGISALLLLATNLPRIRAANGPLLRQFADDMARQLPAEPALILSDDVGRMVLTRAALVRDPKAAHYLFADSGSLRAPDAHRWLNRYYGEKWPKTLSLDRSKPVEDVHLIEFVARLCRSNSLYYLHPSFGYYFEAFYPEAHGLVQKLQFYPQGAILPPELSAELVQTNQQFWAESRQQTLGRLTAALEGFSAGKSPGFLSRIYESLHLKLDPHPDTVAVARQYSKSLNYWGSQLQRRGMFAEAGEMFGLAAELNGDNIVAQINSEYNAQRQKGAKTPLHVGKHLADAFGRYRTWEEVLRECGPYDEPGFCYSQGMQFLQGNLHRQAGQQFHRAVSLYPGHIAAGLELAGMFVVGNMPNEALSILDQLKSESDPAVRQTNQLGLTVAEASAYLVRRDPQKASAVFDQFLAANPEDTKALDSATSLFLRHKLFSEALRWIDHRLKLTPQDLGTLVNKGYAHIQKGQFKEAIPPLSTVIATVTNDLELLDSALFNRAIANLQSGNLEAAAADYRELLPRYESAPQIHYGLAQIAFQRKDTNAAILSAERYLQLAPTNTDEARNLQQRLDELKAGRP